jgi:ketosteroid isomerase-like protein
MSINHINHIAMIIGQAKKNKTQVLEAYKKLDALDIEGFLSYMQEDITYTFGKKFNSNGKVDIKLYLNQLLSEVVEIHHEFHYIFETGNTLVLETEITCTKKDGKEDFFAGVIFLKLEEGLIKVIKMFMDFTPQYL